MGDEEPSEPFHLGFAESAHELQEFAHANVASTVDIVVFAQPLQLLRGGAPPETDQNNDFEIIGANRLSSNTCLLTLIRKSVGMLAPSSYTRVESPA